MEGRLHASCAGWPQPPTAAEFYEAVRADAPNERQRIIVRAWALEATEIEMIRAWAEHAYTWRTLVRALHKSGFDQPQVIRTINDYAQVPEHDGIRTWNS